MKNIIRTFLNPRHKAVQLNKKRGDYLFYYCTAKGTLLTKELITTTIYNSNPIIRENETHTYLRCRFRINGYYAYFDLSIEDINIKKSLEWSLEKLENYVYNNFLSIHGWGLSVSENNI
jgi:hypothetical protein